MRPAISAGRPMQREWVDCGDRSLAMANERSEWTPSEMSQGELSRSQVTRLRLVLGDQLNPLHSWFDAVDDQTLYVLVESKTEATYVRHHRQKLLVFFAAMRRFATRMRRAGHRVLYVGLDEENHPGSISAVLWRLTEILAPQLVEYQEPDEWRVDTGLAKLARQLDVTCRSVSSEHFFTERDEMARYFSNKKQWRMETVYRHLRKRTMILMEEGEPLGGRWNYDADNRNRLPQKEPVPEPTLFDHDVRNLATMTESVGVETMGSADPAHLIWPLDREEALSLLDDFIERLLPQFGRYQDALTSRGWSLFHSRISQALNMKMLSPREVVERVEAAHREDPERVPIAAAEGFVRQILGWREYVRGVYWAKMPDYAQTNALSAKRRLPVWYWTGQTKMACARHAIEQSLEHAYAHHIQRLMITGTFALMAGIDPDEVDAWYLGIYVDAVEWVEMPNTRGMSQFADGGLLASKPYAASANYVNKMSDYCKSCHYDHKNRAGERACPLNSLYWNFYETHRDRFEKHPRIGMVYRLWNKMDKKDRTAILGRAEKVLSQLDEL